MLRGLRPDRCGAWFKRLPSPFRQTVITLLPHPYITALLDNDSVVLRRLYSEYAGRIVQLVVRAGGTAEDARDVMQDALLIIHQKAQRPDFELTSGFYTYLYGICRFVWLKKRDKKVNQTLTLDTVDGYRSEEDLEAALVQRAKQRLFADGLARLGDTCRRILQLFFQRVSMDDIAAELKLDNAHAARNRKYRCVKALENRLKADPRYAELYHSTRATRHE